MMEDNARCKLSNVHSVLVSESAAGASNAREVGRRLDLSLFLVLQIKVASRGFTSGHRTKVSICEICML